MKCSAKMNETSSKGRPVVTSRTWSTPSSGWLSMFSQPVRCCFPEARWRLVILSEAKNLRLDRAARMVLCAAGRAEDPSSLRSSGLVPTEMRPSRDGIPQGRFGHDRRHLLSVEQLDDRLADGRL